MSVYPPPNFEEYLSVFNPANWIASSTGIDTAFLDANYLKFPTAQGTENLLTTNVTGDLSVTGELIIDNTNNKILFDNSSTNIIFAKSSNPITSSTNLVSDNIIISSDSTSGAGFSTGGNACSNNILIGNDIMMNTTPHLNDNPSLNIAIGRGSLNQLIGDNQDSCHANTAIGVSALQGFIGGSNNVGISFNSGTGLTYGTNNIFIGANSGIVAGGFIPPGECSNSVVIGTNALCLESNQIYFGGTATSLVVGDDIPIKFGTSAGVVLDSTLSTGIKYFSIPLGALNTFNWIKDYLTSLLTFTCDSDFQVNLDDSIGVTYRNKPFWLHNSSRFVLTVSSATKQFVGKYGSSASTLTVASGGVVGIYLDGDWRVFFKDSQSSILSNTTETITDLGYLTNSVVRLTPSANQTINLQTLSASSGIFGTTITFSNQSAFTSTLTGVSNFTGLYGTQTSSITIYPNSTIVIQPNQTTLTYDVLSRDTPLLTVDYTYTGASINLTYNEIDSVVNLSGTVTTTINLPNPTTASNPSIFGRYYRIYNNGSVFITLATPAGTFGGIYGNSSATFNVPANTWLELTSNGSVWDIDSRSANITYTVSITGNTNYANNANFTDATLRVNSTGAFTITYPNPTTTTSHSTTSKIVNLSDYTLTISVGAGTFAGRYGSGASTILLPPNCSIELFSNSVDWFVDDRSGDFTFSSYLSSLTTDLTSSQYLDSTYTIIPPEASGSGATALAGTFTQAGNIITVATNTGGLISAGSLLSLSGVNAVVLSQISGTLGGVGSYNVTIPQTIGLAVAFTGLQGSSTLCSGTITQVGYQNNTGRNFNIGTLVSITGSTFDIGTSYYHANINAGYNYNLTSAIAGGTFRNIATSVSPVTATAFWATTGRRINLQVPSASNKGRKYTIVNDSYLPINITTVTGTPTFGGRFGQQANTGSLVSQIYAPPTAPNNFLLFPKKTAVVQSNGTNYELIDGTSIGGNRIFVNNASISQPTDGNNSIANLSPYNIFSQDVFGINLYIDGASNANARLYNNTGYPVTLLIVANCVWNTPAQTTGTNASSSRRLNLNYFKNTWASGGSNAHPNAFNLSHCITGAVNTSTGVFTYNSTSGNAPTNNISTTIMLEPYEAVNFNFQKFNGSATAESINPGNFAIDVTRIA